MSAIVTDQFRILNANNFVDSVVNTANSYYVFVGLPNPDPESIGFGRGNDWDSDIPDPIDNIQYLNHYRDTSIFGKKITSSNIRRVIRRIDWTVNVKYEMYRHDYSILNGYQSPISNSSRLYNTNYYVMNSDYKVYICIDNGSSGANPKGNGSKDEPKFTDLEPSAAGVSGDGYLWKYLFTVSPSDIIKFDSTEYIAIPNDWRTTSDSQIISVRENGDSTLNNNQIKKVYIEDGGKNYSSGEVNILGDGNGGKVLVEVDSNGSIISTTVTSGGNGYTYGIVDLGTLQPPGSIPYPAKLIPIIPPSKGHGYDLYTELGTDKILIYARFDDSTKDFPIDTKFSQIGILKNPISYSSNLIFTQNQYSSLYSIKLTSDFSGTPVVGDEISQTVTGGTAKGYVASYDSATKVLKYFRDRSLYFGATGNSDETDYITVSTDGKALEFESSTNTILPYSASIDTTFNADKVTIGTKVVDLGASFLGGLANPEINKESGEVIYIDNRPLVSRSSRQKEDIKIILEF